MTTSWAPPAVRAVLFDFSGTLFQIGTYADRIRAAMAQPVDDAAMDVMLSGLEAGLSDPDVIEAQRGRDVSSSAHRHAFTAWYASVPELAPVADVLYGQLQAPEYWVPYADTGSTLVRLTRSGVALGVVSEDGGAAAAGLRSYVLPGRATPGSCRGLDAVLRLAHRV
ncbi:hypothetical protein [Streptomyces sp. CB02959]|uniref:hypothetical protein n=1 Tax=Streptomyces sp. CB02959 TaxID=2020330 RepID=UPI0021524D32|nr:hypothetical protein [Streptomyces sp. CB02959]